ncbi:MAG: hypothetical protein COZ16_02145 [Flavobacteriaceae bacterium CG_4_10_14_3_um_filter_31_253]|nr:MAG: hypothetical protein COZ16_02145 [Flavobacteriaceae bacterium CG_4_10_14_3_um_filter_31_253]PJC09043.1 MAG: hypothetical protein CO067_12345 [Flavobacteriaceae bacterium CG_4_9_14_0_8_um_filter_31_91]
MKKKIIWLFILAFIVVIGYLVTLSDPPIDESIKFVDINSYLTKKEMTNDIDSLTKTFEIIHPNPYRFINKAGFTSKVKSIKVQLPDSLKVLNFWRLLDQIIINYNDAHSNLDDSYVLTDYVKKERLFFPLSAKIQNEKLIVSKSENIEQILPEGTEILKINGKTNKEIIESLLKHATKETRFLKLLEISDDFGFYLWKTYDWDSEYKIHYRSNESAQSDSIIINGVKWGNRQNPSKIKTESYNFTLLKNNVGLLKITDFNGDEGEIKNFYEKTFETLAEKNSSHLILDFRGHSGGADSYGEHLAKYFAKEPYRKLSRAYWKITPDFKQAFDRRFIPKGIRWFKPIYLVNEYSSIFYGAEQNELVTVNYEMKRPLSEEDRYLGNVYLITDHNTFSAGSIFAEMFKFYNMGKIVGQPTGNLYSFNGFALANFTLPNSKLSFQVSSVYNIANNEEEGIKSVQPDDIIDLKKDPVDYIIETYIQ